MNPDTFKVTPNLRLVFEVETEKHGTCIIHIAPIGRETLGLYFAELGAVFKACYAEDDGARHLALIGPQIAYMALQSAAEHLGTWDTPSGVRNGLVNEFIRLSGVAYAGAAGEGWKHLPMASALARGVIDQDTQDEILSAISFFTAASRVGPKKLTASLLPVIGESLGWEYGSWQSTTEYLASLRTLTPDETSKPPEVRTVEAAKAEPASPGAPATWDLS